MPNVRRLLPTTEVAERLGRDVRTIHRWVEAGRLLPIVRGPGLRGALLFAEPDVERLAAELAAEEVTP